MTREQAIKHNRKVVGSAIRALFDFKMVDPLKMLTDRNYANRSIQYYMDADNLTRQTLGLPPVKLYDINEFEEE